MTTTQVLIGSLSNDLLRVATMIQRGSEKGAERFLVEAKHWNAQLKDKDLKPYIQKIVADIEISDNHLTMETAEKFLMYSVLLQNYSFKNSL